MVYVFHIFCFDKIYMNKLKFLFGIGNNVLRCSEHEYLIFQDWIRFSQFNITCKNQGNIFEIEPPDLIEEFGFYIKCDEDTKLWYPYIKSKYFTNKHNKTKSLCPLPLTKILSNPLSHLTGTVNDSYDQYSFHAKCDDDKIRIKLGEQSFMSKTNDSMHTLYVKFDSQPLICRLLINQTYFIQKQKCIENTNYTIKSICYYYPDLDSLSIAIDWNYIRSFFLNSSHSPPNWHDKKGYYYNSQTENSSSTILQTTSIADSTSDSSFIPFDSTAILTNSDSSLEMTSNIISTSVAVDSTLTTAVTTKLCLTTVKNIKTSKKTVKSSIKSTRSNILLGKFPPKKKNPSSHMKYIIILLPVIGIIVLMLCFGFLYRHYQEIKRDSFLNRNDSDESHVSKSIESDDTKTSTVALLYDQIPLKQHETSKITLKHGSGRIYSQLDPDTL